MKRKKIITVVGARPQFIKAAVLSKLFNNINDIEEIIIHSGQHYDFNMSDQFFDELGIPNPKYNLGVNSSTQASQTGTIMAELEPILKQEEPDLVLVYGDTNTTLAAAITAAKQGLSVAHIEAGLRSYRKGMAEEVNRVLTDRISDYLFCPSLLSFKNLQAEGRKEHLYVVGDIMLDIFLQTLQKANIAMTMSKFGLEQNNYYFVTFHRAENVDNPKILKEIVYGLSCLAEAGKPVIVALHPRTQKAINNLCLSLGRARIVDPLSYTDTVAMLKYASVVITDSGGLQKEAYFAETSCVTIRDETEWKETLEMGHNRLLSPERCAQLSKVIEKIETSPFDDFTPLYGKGDAGIQIVGHLKTILNV